MEDITLTVVAPEPETDSVITANEMPALTGNGPADLKCGGCHEVLAKGLNVDAIDRAFTTERRLLLRCTCGAHNLIHDAKSETIVLD